MWPIPILTDSPCSQGFSLLVVLFWRQSGRQELFLVLAGGTIMSQVGKKKPSLLWEFFEKLPDGSGKYQKSECQKILKRKIFLFFIIFVFVLFSLQICLKVCFDCWGDHWPWSYRDYLNEEKKFVELSVLFQIVLSWQLLWQRLSTLFPMTSFHRYY